MQKDLHTIKQNAISKQELENHLDPIRKDILSITQRIQRLEIGSQSGSSRSPSETASAIGSKIKALEQHFEDKFKNRDKEVMAVFGGMKFVSSKEEALKAMVAPRL